MIKATGYGGFDFFNFFYKGVDFFGFFCYNEANKISDLDTKERKIL